MDDALRPIPQVVAPGQESVWDYPRPPRLERTVSEIQIDFAGRTIAKTRDAYRVLETSHPPTYYLPPSCFERGVLQNPTRSSICEWKGAALALDIVAGERIAVRAAWNYPAPTPAFAPIAGYVAVYAGATDGCFVDGERVVPQPGGFYGGWITANIVGPFKGGTGTMGW